MPLSKDRIVALGTTYHRHEQDALEFAIKELPDQHPFLLWGLVDLVDNSGRRYDVDLLVLGFHALYLIEIKSYPGRISGDVVDWVIDWPDGRQSRKENPDKLTSHKSRVLASMLQRQMQKSEQRPPWVQPLIFAAAEDVKVDLQGAAGKNVITRKNFLRALQQGDYPGAPPQARNHPINKPQALEVLRALKAMGLRESKAVRKVNDLVLGKLLVEHDNYQDHVAENEKLKAIKSRVRTYQIASGVTQERRDQLVRAAEREASMLSVLSDHPNILKLKDYVAQGPTGAPCLVFDHFENAQPLDAFLRTHPNLDLNDRTTIIARVADALAYCHRKSVLHRGLAPSSVLVQRNEESGKLDVRLFNFQLATLTEADTGTMHGTSHSTSWRQGDEIVYVAPEVLQNPGHARKESDVFSLGALAYFVLVGKPPGQNIVEREMLLQRGYLSPAMARDDLALGLGAHGNDLGIEAHGHDLETVMELATHRNPVDRTDEAGWWAEQFLDALTAPPAETKPHYVPPLEARGKDKIAADMLVQTVLGTGSTARTLRIRYNDSTFALKVALSPDHDVRLQREGEILTRLQSDRGCDRIVKLHGVHEVGGRTCLRLTDAGETLGRLLAEEGAQSVDYARRWGEDLLLALEHLEERGVQHRDIKPGNLGVLSPEQKRKRHLMLFDFSLSRADGNDVTLGTPAYRDPFLPARGRWDDAADRYSAAVTLHEIITGERPRWGDQDIANATNGEITLAAERFDATVRDRLIGFFRKALARKVDDRFASADDMRAAWVSALTGVALAPDVALSPELEAGSTVAGQTVAAGDGSVKPPALPESLSLTTPIEALPLAARAKNALSRAGVLRVEELLRLPNNQLSAMRGSGRGTAKEILHFMARPEFDRLRAALPSQGSAADRFAPGYAGAPVALHFLPELNPAAKDRLRQAGLLDLASVASASTERITQILVDLPDAVAVLKGQLARGASADFGVARSLDGWVALAFPEVTQKRGDKAAQYVRQLYGLDAVKGQYVDSVATLASLHNVTRPLIYQAVAKLREDWLTLPFLETLHALVFSVLDGGGGVSLLSQLALSVAQSLAPAEEGFMGAVADHDEARVRKAQALVRLTVETSDNLRLGRARSKLWVGTADADFARLDDLGAAADALALAEPLLSPGVAVERLRAAVANTDLAGLSDEPLVALAVAASTKAARSARMEIYPRGMSAERALNLSVTSLPPRDVDLPLLRRIVAARYPEAEALPRGAALQRMMEGHGYELDVVRGHFNRRGTRSDEGTQASLTRVATTHTGHRAPVDPEAYEFSQAIEVRKKRGSFCVLEVTPAYARSAAEELATRLGVQALSVEAELLSAARELMLRDHVSEDIVFTADREGPRGGEWGNLCDLMKEAAGVVLEGLRRRRDPLVLTNPGLLARFRLQDFLKELIVHARDNDAAPAIFLIVPMAEEPGRARIAYPGGDLAIETTSDAQRLRVPLAWLKNYDRGRKPSYA